MSEYQSWLTVYLYLSYFIWSTFCILAPFWSNRYGGGRWCILVFQEQSSIYNDQYSRLLIPYICHFGKSFVTGFLLEITDMEGIPGAFWVCLETNQVSVPTNVVVFLYVTCIILVNVLYLGSFWKFQIWRGPWCVLGLFRNESSI